MEKEKYFFGIVSTIEEESVVMGDIDNELNSKLVGDTEIDQEDSWEEVLEGEDTKR